MEKSKMGGGEDFESPHRGLKLTLQECRGVRGTWSSKVQDSSIPQAVGKLFSTKSGFADGMAQALGKIWCPQKGIRCKKLGNNLFLFSFLQPGGKQRAVTEGPWEFGGDLLIVVDFDKSKRLKDLEFNHIPVWIRVFDLPLGTMNEETGRRIGDSVGTTLEVDTDEDGLAIGEYLRIKVLIDVRNPLCRGITLEQDEGAEASWCSFKYEFLPNYCYSCGLLGHVEKNCDDAAGKQGEKQFGEWLRVYPTRKRKGLGRWLEDGSSGGSQLYHGGSLTERPMAPLCPSPELIDDAVAEILLRIPPDEPADLFRASLVDKRWHRILTDPAFLRRYREFHRPPPLLGFFHNHLHADVGLMPRFVATTGATPVPEPEFDGEKWWAVSGHHGRVLIDIGHIWYTGQGLVVWDPITGDRHRIYLPAGLHDTLCAPTVLCALGSSCNHLNCHSGPFLVVGMELANGAIRVFVYSSEAGAWTQPASISSGGVNYMSVQKGTLVGDEIYFTLGWGDAILKYEVDKNRLSVFGPPEVYERGASLVQMGDGSLGLAGSKGSTIYLWSRKGTRKGAAGWVKSRVMNFEKLLPSSKLFDTVDVIGFAGGVGIMFMGTFVGVFTVELKSGKMKRIGDPGVFYPIVPFTRFCTPDIIVHHPNLSLTDGKRATTLPVLNKKVIIEILLRVPPDEPVDLVRSSLVCKSWRRILTDPTFLRRYHDFHRRPPLLGFFHNHPPDDVGPMPRFIVTTGASPFSELEFDEEVWWAMDCHHGRVLLDVEEDIGDSGKVLVVWDPITNDRHRIDRPVSLCGTFYSPTVLCAVGSCNHFNCHSGPFLVVGVGFVAGAIHVFVYSSEARAWTQPASIDSGGVNYMGAQKGTLMGNEIYYTLGWGDRILKYEVDKNHLSVFDPPEVYERGASLVQMEDGSLGLAGSKGSTIYLWSRKEIREGAAGWVQCKVLDFERLLPSSNLFGTADVIGFAEAVGIMFVGTFAGVYTVELKSGKLKRIGDPGVFYPIVPFTSFYTPDFGCPKLPWRAADMSTAAEYAW